jgi:hypothetical protein
MKRHRWNTRFQLCNCIKSAKVIPSSINFGALNTPQLGQGEAKLLSGFQPGRKIEEYFKKLNRGVAIKISEDERRKNKLKKEHGFEKVAPPLTYLKQ